MVFPCTETPVHCWEPGGKPVTPSTPCLQEPVELQDSRLPHSLWKPVHTSNQDAGPSPPPPPLPFCAQRAPCPHP